MGSRAGLACRVGREVERSAHSRTVPPFLYFSKFNSNAVLKVLQVFLEVGTQTKVAPFQKIYNFGLRCNSKFKKDLELQLQLSSRF